jgi:CRISPR-associated protein Cas1
MEAEKEELKSERQTGPNEIVRRLLPARDDQIPVYVVGQGNTVRKRGERLEIWSREGKVSEARIMETSQLSLYGGVEITTPAMVELMQRGVPIIHYTHGGWFQGISQGMTHKNVELRMKQFQCATTPRKALAIASCMISGKIKNCRTLLRRNDSGAPRELLALMAKLAKDAENAYSSESLLGIEGAAAEAYFSRFSNLLKGGAEGFSFENRNKRPPKDPVNAVLSYLYGILVKDLFVTLLAVGFDPYLGLYHRPRYGRPALALDMMEEFRPLVADSTAITLFNNGELSKKDFIRAGFGISLTPEGKKKVIEGYERRMETNITHPIFRYSVSYRRLLEVQARLLARVISGEVREYPAFCTR